MRLISFCIFLTFSFNNLYSQCSSVSVVEAVRNGDFESGYLTGSDTIHEFTEGSEFDFFSDFTFQGEFDPESACVWAFGGKYAVARAETYSCSGMTHVNEPYWATDYSDSIFQDHTVGLNGKGFCLISDNYSAPNNIDSSKHTIWGQKVAVIPNQKYWFSCWVAKYGDAQKVSPEIAIVVLPILNGEVDSINIDTISTKSLIDTIAWEQKKGIWEPNLAYDSVVIKIVHVKLDNGYNGLDLLVDDISFINSDQNYLQKYTTNDTEINPCINSKEHTISVNDLSGNSVYLNGNSINWYKGPGQVQTIQNQWTNDSVILFTEEGSYRYCIDFNGSTINGNVDISASISKTFEDLTLCENTEYTIKVDYNHEEIKSINWETQYGSFFNKDSIIVNKKNSILVYSIPQGDFNCSIRDTFIVQSFNSIIIDTVKYCYNDSLTVPFATEFSYVSADVAGVKFLGAGEVLKIHGKDIPKNSNQLYIRNVNRTPLGFTDQLNLESNRSWFQGDMKFVISDDVVLKSFKIRLPNFSQTDTVVLSIDGPVNYTMPLVLEYDSTMQVETIINLPAGEYIFSTNISIQTEAKSNDQNYFNNKVQSIGTNFNHFLSEMEFEQIAFFCQPTTFPIKRYDYCFNSSKIKDSNTATNGCVNETFEISLKDTLENPIVITTQSISWFGPNDYESEITPFEDLSAVQFSDVGSYRYKVVDAQENTVFNGFVEVTEGYELDFNSTDICKFGSSQEFVVNPYSNSSISGFEWNSMKNGTYQSDSYQLTEADTVYVHAITIGNFNCQFEDTIIANDFSIDIDDTIYFCSVDTALKISTNISTTYFSKDSLGVSFLSQGADYSQSYPGWGLIAPIYVHNNTITDIANEFTYFDPLFPEMISSSYDRFFIEFKKDVFLDSFQITLPLGTSSPAFIKIGNSPAMNIYFDQDTIITVNQKTFIPKGNTQFYIQGSSYNNYIPYNSVDTSIYYLDSLFHFELSTQNIFMQKMNFSEVASSCPPVKVQFVKDDQKCIITGSLEIESQFKIYPNPTTGLIKFDRAIEYGQLYNLQGKLMCEFTNRSSFNISKLPSGTYSLKVGHIIKKIILVK